jgi:hypothetical protein
LAEVDVLKLLEFEPLYDDDDELEEDGNNPLFFKYERTKGNLEYKSLTDFML